MNAPRRARVAGAVVAGLHALAIVVMLTHTRQAAIEVDRERAGQLVLVDATLAPPLPRPPSTATASPVRAAEPERRRRLPVWAPAPEVEVAATRSAGAVAASSTRSDVAATASAPETLPAAPASAPAPLRLALSKDQLRGFAATPQRPADALRHVAKQHGERVAEAIEAAIGGGEGLTVEALGNGEYRARVGHGCVRLTPTAMSLVDPVGHGKDPMLVRPCP